jgi:putative transposase
MASPSTRRRAARHLVEGRWCSVNQACGTLRLAKATFYGVAARGPGPVVGRIKHLSLKHPRYGYRLITQLLRQEGWVVNRKRVQRVRRQESLQVVPKMSKARRARAGQGERLRAERAGQVWSYDFIHDRLENGAGLKMLTALDEFTRECLGIKVARSITAPEATDYLAGLFLERGQPEHLRSDNGPEFVAGALQSWAQEAGIRVN